jgi:hypothetical protein
LKKLFKFLIGTFCEAVSLGVKGYGEVPGNA